MFQRVWQDWKSSLEKCDTCWVDGSYFLIFEKALILHSWDLNVPTHPAELVHQEQQKDNDIFDFSPCPCMHACVCPILGFASSLVWWWQKEVAKQGRRVSERGGKDSSWGVFILPLSVLYCFLDGETAWHFHSFGQSLLVSHRTFLQLLGVCQCCHHLKWTEF